MRLPQLLSSCRQLRRLLPASSSLTKRRLHLVGSSIWMAASSPLKGRQLHSVGNLIISREAVVSHCRQLHRVGSLILCAPSSSHILSLIFLALISHQFSRAQTYLNSFAVFHFPSFALKSNRLFADISQCLCRQHL